MNNPNHQMNPSSRFRPCSPASFPHHHMYHLCPHHHHHHGCHHHHHGCHHHQHTHSHIHHHHFNCHAHVLHSNLSPPPPSPLQNPEPETYPSQKDSNFGDTTNIHTQQTFSSAIQVFNQPEEEEEGLLEQGEEDDDDDNPVFVLTDEWREFFTRSEAKRQLEKKQRAKERKQRNVR